MNIAKKIFELRHQHQLTQQQFAAIIYLYDGDLKMFGYWTGSALLIFSLTYL